MGSDAEMAMEQQLCQALPLFQLYCSHWAAVTLPLVALFPAF